MRLLSLFFSILPTLLFAQSYLPTHHGQVVKHNYYTLSYVEQHEQAEWVYYVLTSENLQGSTKRLDNFRADPKVTTRSAQLDDYKRSGYDRGHLCPAAAMKSSRLAMSESFYLSNMSPQEPSFNRGIWKKLEEQVRGWARNEGKVYVISGPIFNGSTKHIGRNRVTVPKQYYKVIYAPRANKMIAFVLPNRKCNLPLRSYIKSVDQVEQQTGLDFFSQLPDATENRLEAKTSSREWRFAPTTHHYRRGKSVSQRRRSISHQSKYTSERCHAITQKGTRCKRKASRGSRYCWQHQKRH